LNSQLFLPSLLFSLVGAELRRRARLRVMIRVARQRSRSERWCVVLYVFMRGTCLYVSWKNCWAHCFFKDCLLCTSKCCDCVLRSVCGDWTSLYQKVTTCWTENRLCVRRKPVL